MRIDRIPHGTLQDEETLEDTGSRNKRQAQILRDDRGISKTPANELQRVDTKQYPIVK